MGGVEIDANDENAAESDIVVCYITVSILKYMNYQSGYKSN